MMENEQLVFELWLITTKNIDSQRSSAFQCSAIVKLSEATKGTVLDSCRNVTGKLKKNSVLQNELEFDQCVHFLKWGPVQYRTIVAKSLREIVRLMVSFIWDTLGHNADCSTNILTTWTQVTVSAGPRGSRQKPLMGHKHPLSDTLREKENQDIKELTPMRQKIEDDENMEINDLRFLRLDPKVKYPTDEFDLEFCVHFESSQSAVQSNRHCKMNSSPSCKESVAKLIMILNFKRISWISKRSQWDLEITSRREKPDENLAIRYTKPDEDMILCILIPQLTILLVARVDYRGTVPYYTVGLSDDAQEDTICVDSGILWNLESQESSENMKILLTSKSFWLPHSSLRNYQTAIHVNKSSLQNYETVSVKTVGTENNNKSSKRCFKQPGYFLNFLMSEYTEACSTRYVGPHIDLFYSIRSTT
ncbi:hypothetical protein WN51_03402 [Melipona quadrifasciata]|uniref:Uncharacterized protein n=1 Tax=Melipona quadrifasciata TaxID=166423 RepID=A0A0N0BEJ3_9HYME|nr:hypothetical protein WN51_03402 [Melipona quadrifasciata]